MKQLEVIQMENIQGGDDWIMYGDKRISWKCWFGLGLIALGFAAALTGVGAVGAGGAISGGAGMVITQC